MPVAALVAPLAGLIASGLGDLGAVGGAIAGLGAGSLFPAGLIPTALAGAAESGAAGLALSPLTGQTPLHGLESGAIGGGVGSVAGPVLGSALGAAAPGLGEGLASGIGNAVGSGIGGAIGSAATGGSPLLGAASGAGSSLIGGALTGGSTTAAPEAGSGAGTSGAAAAPAPALGTGVGAGALAGPSVATGSLGGGDFSGGGLGSSPTAGVGTSGGGGAGGSAPLSAAGAGTVGSGSVSGAPGGGNFLSNLFSGASGAADFSGGTPGPGGTTTGSGVGSAIGNWLAKNPSTLLGGALLAGSTLFGNKEPPGLSTLQSQGAQESTLANEALSGLQTGQVPPGAQSLLDNMSNAMQTDVRSKYASLGLSGSTMEGQDLANVDQQVAANKWGIINNLLGTGTNAMGLANTMDQASLSAQVQQDERMQQSISAFAAALAGGGMRGTTYSLTPTA